MNNTIKIYITDLSAYNNGHLVGEWVTLPSDDINADIARVLTNGALSCNDGSIHEEVFITDYEAPIKINEYDNIQELNELAETLQDLDEHDLLKLELLIYEGYNEREVLNAGLDSYDVDIYDYSSDTSFTDVYELLAYDFVSDGLFGEIPSHLENYLDYSAIARDLSMDYTEFKHGVIGRVA